HRQRCTRGKLLPITYQASDILSMPCQKCFETKFLHLAPSILIPNLGGYLTRRDGIEQGGNFVEEFARLPQKSRCNFVRDQSDEDKKSKIDFYHRRPSKILEKKGMTLQPFDHRIEQVGKQYGKEKDHQDASSAVDERKPSGEQHNCQQ